MNAARDAVEAASSRSRAIVVALVGGVLALAAASGFFRLEPLTIARAASFPLGLAGLGALVLGWRLYASMRERAAAVEDVAEGCGRHSTALLAALAVTEGVAFLGLVFHMLGAELIALTGILTHVLLSGALWPTPQKIVPFLGRAGRGLEG